MEIIDNIIKIDEDFSDYIVKFFDSYDYTNMFYPIKGSKLGYYLLNNNLSEPLIQLREEKIKSSQNDFKQEVNCKLY